MVSTHVHTYTHTCTLFHGTHQCQSVSHAKQVLTFIGSDCWPQTWEWTLFTAAPLFLLHISFAFIHFKHDANLDRLPSSISNLPRSIYLGSVF